MMVQGIGQPQVLPQQGSQRAANTSNGAIAGSPDMKAWKELPSVSIKPAHEHTNFLDKVLRNFDTLADTKTAEDWLGLVPNKPAISKEKLYTLTEKYNKSTATKVFGNVQGSDIETHYKKKERESLSLAKLSEELTNDGVLTKGELNAVVNYLKQQEAKEVKVNDQKRKEDSIFK